MNKITTGSIYSICVGDPITGMKYRVGQKVGKGQDWEGVISGIVDDEVSFLDTGIKTYIVFVKPYSDDFYEFVWRKYESQPVEIIYSAFKKV